MIQITAATRPKATTNNLLILQTATEQTTQDGWNLCKLPMTSTRYLGSVRGDLIESAVKKARKEGGDQNIHIHLKTALQVKNTAVAIAKALPKYSAKTAEKAKLGDVKVTFEIEEGSLSEKELKEMMALTENVREAARLVDMPPNQLDTTAYVKEVKSFADQHSKTVKLETITGEDLKNKGYGLIYSVGKIAPQPPSLAILHYTPLKPSTSLFKLGLVGKGIIYDSGGMSLKSTPNMCGMKADMGGSAAVYGAFRTLVETEVDFPITAVLCLAENPIGPGASRNDDIVTGYSGKTVEINNTDAEGRLVLADGIAHISKHCAPTHIIDIATLTGAQGFATGNRHAAVMSSCQKLEDTVVKAGQTSGDWCFPLLYAPELLMKEFDSEVADMKNSVKDRTNASSSAAGHFIEAHISPEWKGKWAHVDIAFPAISGERGTGYGVALLVEAALKLEGQAKAE